MLPASLSTPKPQEYKDVYLELCFCKSARNQKPFSSANSVVFDTSLSVFSSLSISNFVVCCTRNHPCYPSFTSRTRHKRLTRKARDHLTTMPHTTNVALSSLAILAVVHAAPAPLPTNSPQSTTGSPTTAWSKEAIFTLIGIPVALVGILVTLLLSSAKARRWLYYPCRGALATLDVLVYKTDGS
jgi:hypothetical protein